MWWPDTLRFEVAARRAEAGPRALKRLRTFARLAPVLAICALAAPLGGCFQPMYASASSIGGPGLHEALASVDVAQIAAVNGTSDARIAVQLRNALTFDFNGGAEAPKPTHRLTIRLNSSRQAIITDLLSARAEIQNYGLDANYSLTEIATGKTVVTGQTFARVSYDIPGQVQRFAALRGMRDAENRAADVIAEQVRARLASYFVAGT